MINALTLIMRQKGNAWGAHKYVQLAHRNLFAKAVLVDTIRICRVVWVLALARLQSSLIMDPAKGAPL